ncbi:cysteine desulfuration protein SufE [Nicoletella semolina]|uniref:Cysteine desulfuration protein SufE n=1 Tax=Nicoletella semolina TaxID=271160 RepID=A0A4R2N4F6_9PAST|nr:SufE family protein [Nicoletella semolina]MDH2925101.1 hypothetical protein [Nicoletella semolina]TCP15382.1 cysteine desulfuration protein SufE [Nicoletella semolina]
MQLEEMYQQFARCKNWEERYRLLIQFSRQLPKPSEEELAQWQEIEGCESRLWFEFQPIPRQVKAYSDARLMQGMLAVLIVALEEQSLTALQHFDIPSFFDKLRMTNHLSSTRLNGLKQIQAIVQQKSQGKR